MVWQDFIITGANIIFSVSLIPQVILGFKHKKGYIGLWTSGPTTLGLLAISYSLYTLELYLSTIVSVVSGLLWSTLFLQGWIYRKK